MKNILRLFLSAGADPRIPGTGGSAEGLIFFDHFICGDTDIVSFSPLLRMS
jgi:hypothetical protein